MISGFGLSAFLFSTIAHTLFPGNTSEFLLVLAVGTALPMILGFFFIRPIPPPPLDTAARLEHAIDDSDDDYGAREGLGAGSPTTYSPANNSHTHLLSHDADDDDEPSGSRIELEEEEEPSYLQDVTKVPDFVDEAPVEAADVSSVSSLYRDSYHLAGSCRAADQGDCLASSLGLASPSMTIPPHLYDSGMQHT